MSLLGLPAVAILGSRGAPVGRIAMARSLASLAATAGLAVVAGDAAEIERRALVAAGLRGVLVVSTHASPARAARRGLVVAEGGHEAGASGSPGGPGGRLRARRIQVAISDAVLLLASGRESDVMHAAGLARVLGRPLYAVEPAGDPGAALLASAPGSRAGTARAAADDRHEGSLAGLRELVSAGIADPLGMEAAPALLASLAG